MISKLMIANRGEIACRVMRTAQDMGVRTVALYSEADAQAPHVAMADESYLLGPAPVVESYLNQDRVLEAARATGSDAVHPGYGFLSENAGFAAACQDAGLTFVGPSAHAIELMGDKAAAKRAMIDAGVPCVPGYQGEDQRDATLVTAAREIGYPLMIKAAAGGGGRGMRLVTTDNQLEAAINTARSEAVNAFGNGELIIEKAIIQPRHVEIQVFGDSHGNLVYLFERDCSVQRRHQKVIEEAPCPVMSPALRQQMGEAAVAAARAVNYEGAGTVEFLLGADNSFYFLEMNTRLQVEHPVTELVTGLDLVELQLTVAAGEPLGFNQADLALKGHAIEVRLYAEDPRQDFLPSTGQIEYWREPAGTHIRVDAGVESGGEVSPFYDPMLAKVIASGSDREEARRHLVRALGNSLLVGPANNRDFLIDALSRQAFIDGEATTAFISEEYGDDGFICSPGPEELCLAALTQTLYRKQDALQRSPGVNPELLNWSSGIHMTSVCLYRLGDETYTVTVHPLNESCYEVSCQDDVYEYEVISFDGHELTLRQNQLRLALQCFTDPLLQHITLATPRIEFSVTDIAAGEILAEQGGDGQVTAPMHGQLLEILVSEGEEVARGQRLAILEAMKMQHEIVAEVAGQVTAIHAQAQTQVSLDQLLIEIEPAASES